jgi:CIC family chloride channel protein
VLFPALFLGGVSGAAYAKCMRALAEFGWLPPSLALTPTARASLILVGMGGVFAAATKTPIASLVMVSEITGSYGLVVPLMITCASAYILSRSFTLNEEQVRGIADSPAHRGEFLIDVLEGITVADAIPDLPKPELIPASMPYDAIMERVKQSNSTVFPVVDERECLLGIFALSDLRQIMGEPDVSGLVVAGDLGVSDPPCLYLQTNLDEALRLFTQRNLDSIPVVAAPSEEEMSSVSRISKAVKPPRGPVGKSRVIGMLSRRDLIAAYHRRLNALRSADEKDSEGSNVFDQSAAGHSAEHGHNAHFAGPSSSAAQPGMELLDDPPENAR